MLFTTKKLLHKERACAARFRHFFKRYRPVADDEPIPLIDVLDINGLDDALWCLRATTEPCENLARLLAADFAEHVLPLFETKFPDDHRLRQAIETARRFARGQATEEELKDAYRNARAAAGAADAAGYGASAAGYAADAASDAAASGAIYAACYAAEAAVDARAEAAELAADAADVSYDSTAANRAAAYASERRWQTHHFREALIAHPGANAVSALPATVA
jgi:hypothetical protein